MSPSSGGVDGTRSSQHENTVTPNPFRIGVLGSAESWYFRDLMRAAQLDCWDRPVELSPFSFSDLQVAYRGGAASVVEFSDHQALDALLVRTMPLGSLEQTIFRMNALQIARSTGVRVVNPPRALEIAIDKWLTLDFLRQAGLEIPRTVCCQNREAAMAAWESLGKDCVVKPLFGGEGRGIVRVQDPDMAWRVFSTLEQLQSVIYVQEFLESPGYDLRLLVIGDAVFCVKRQNPLDWRSNVSRGGTAVEYEPTFEQVAIAFRACRSIDAWMAGVDILTTDDGRDLVLEVNAVPGWRATAAALQVDIARVVLEKLLER